ncbi:MAG: hypothetical protein RJQ07_13130 [Pseudomonadales bacterium]
MRNFYDARFAVPCVLLLVLLMTACEPNRVQLENLRPGTADWEITNLVTPTDWNLIDPGRTTQSNAEIEGYASATSVNIGEDILFYVNSRDPYVIEFFRMGWYEGLGARKMRPEIYNDGSNIQAPCLHDAQTHRIECDWIRPNLLTVPDDWVSGIYLARLNNRQTGHQSYIHFVVRDDARPAAFLFQASVTTYQAYNRWGGYNLYPHGGGREPAIEVSFDRPYDQGYGSQGHEGAGDFLLWEINMLRWLERAGYDVTYATNIDVHRDPSLLNNRRAFLSVGHDEYWSEAMRDHVEAARDQCVSLGFFSANTAFWRIRLEPNYEGIPNRTIFTRKEETCGIDPETGLWRTGCPGVEARPEDALIGVMFDDPIHGDNDIVVTNTDHWAFEGTGLQPGDRLLGVLGYETDRLFGNAPADIVTLGESPVCPASCSGRTTPDCAETISEPCVCDPTGDGGPQGVSHMTVYETAEGSAVFATGSIQWSWGLDDYESSWDTTPHCPRAQPAVRQITRNVLTRFMISPCSPPGLP